MNPFAGDPQYSLANALWDLKRTHFRTAQSLGLATDLIITPNHVFRDQLKPEWLAKPGPRIQGQLICPHQPGAREAILKNYTHLFADLAKAGVNLTAINSAPYDYDGCGCDQCKPSILTFPQLTRGIHNYDDVNKALLGGLFSGKEKTSRDVLETYARCYFAANDIQSQQWADWPTPWGTPFSVDAIAARKALNRLSGALTCWRRRQWELKADMFAANHAIGPGDNWPTERLAHADQFWAAEEKLQREVYGTGPLRHILNRRFVEMPWYKSWASQPPPPPRPEQ